VIGVRFVEPSWNVTAHGDGREGKWRGNWRVEWVASTLHTTSERDVSSINTADAYTSAASSRLNWPPRRLKWTRPFLRKTKSSFCACAVTFQLVSTRSAEIKVCLVDRSKHSNVSVFCLSSKFCMDVRSVTNVNAKFWKGWCCALLRSHTAAQFVWIPITHFRTKRVNETSAALWEVYSTNIFKFEIVAEWIVCNVLYSLTTPHVWQHRFC